MSEAHRSDTHDAGSNRDADRDAKIEQLLILGLDHYFAARYELAINVWTRALFFDRSHPRARAYIERARSALAERQRESEELLHTGVAAFERGEGLEARRLLQAAIEGGAPTDEALAILDRLDRLETVVLPATAARGGRPVRQSVASEARRSRRPVVLIAFVMAGTVVAGGLAAILADVPAARPLGSFLRTAGNVAITPAAPPAPPVTHESPLAVPMRGEITLSRAKRLAAGGHVYDAIVTLESIRPTDVEKAEADRFRGELQRQLLAATPLPPSVSQDRDKSNRPIP